MKTLVWHIPKTKNGKPFSVPLTPQMLQILKAVKNANNSPYVFHQKRDANKPLSENAGTVHLKKVWGFNTGEITMHGFRATFSTYMNNLPELNPRVIDACIEHQMGDPIEQSYNRSGWLNKRRHYMEIWNDYCVSLVNT
jgi:integrase